MTYEYQCKRCGATHEAERRGRGNPRSLCDGCRPRHRAEWTAAYVRDPVNAKRARERNRAWQEENPESARSSYYKYTYGITAEDYVAMLNRQNGVCAICQQPERGTHKGKPRRLAVDHDHATMAVRGLLCSSCNQALGHAGDSPEMLEAMAAYLRAQDNS